MDQLQKEYINLLEKQDNNNIKVQLNSYDRKIIEQTSKEIEKTEVLTLDQLIRINKVFFKKILFNKK